MTEQETGEMHQDTSNIAVAGDTVKVALAAMVRNGDYTPEQEATLWWFYAHSRDQGFTLKEAGKQIGKDSTTLFRVWAGKYGASVANICQDIERYRKIAEERALIHRIDFVETSVWKIVDRVCTATLNSQTISRIYGDSQIGKTTCLEEYARRNNHGQTKLIRMPASAGVQLFMREVARACYVSAHASFEGMRERVLNAVDDKTLLIFDEMHQAFLSYQAGSTIKVFEVIREIYDRTKCGVVLVGTNTLKQEFYTGKLSAVLEQLRRRGTIEVDLKSRIPKPDLDKIASKFGLPPATGVAEEVIKDMIHRSGLGMYIKFLQSANALAGKQGKKLCWDHFVQAHDIMAKLSVREST